VKLLKYHIHFTVLPEGEEPREEQITLTAFNIVTAAQAATSVLNGREDLIHIHTVEEDTP